MRVESNLQQKILSVCHGSGAACGKDRQCNDVVAARCVVFLVVVRAVLLFYVFILTV